MQKITAVIKNEKYKTEIRTESNVLIADEPVSLGGQGSGFAPRELLASSLGACTAITLKMYAERKGWDLQEAKVEVVFNWDKETSKSIIHRTIEFVGALDEEQKERLMVIANACPVHKMLTNPIEIVTAQGEMSL